MADSIELSETLEKPGPSQQTRQLDASELETDAESCQPIAKVILYQAFLPFQGRFPRVSDQCRILAEQGFNVQVLACDRNATHEIDGDEKGIPVHRLRVKTKEWQGPICQIWPLLVFYFRSILWLRKQKFDIAIVHNLDVVPLGFLIRLLLRKPVLFDAHEPNYYAMWSKKRSIFLSVIRWIEKSLSRRMTAITVTNQYQVEKYTDMGIERVKLIGNYPSPEHRIDEFPADKFGSKEVVFGRIGTVYRNTGFEQVVNAFKPLLLERNDVRLFVAGRVVDEYQEDFEKLIAPVSDRVTRIGAFDAGQMPELYSQIDVSLLIYPRTNWFREITPTKFYDSLANALPVIMTDIGRLGSVIDRERCGLVVDEDDPESIRSAVAFLVETESRREMAQNAYQLSHTEYNWETLSQTYAEFVKGLLSSNQKTVGAS